MPALFVDSCSQLKTILEKSESLSSHNWLISYLECYDTIGWDGSYTYICAHVENLLKPFNDVPYRVIDAEEDNKIMNRNLCRIQDILRNMIPGVSEVVANDVQWECWHTLLPEKKRKEDISDENIKRVIKAAYKKVSAEGYRFRYTYWNPYSQK